MMTYRSVPQNMRSLDMMLETILKEHHNHDHRNRRMLTVRLIIEHWLLSYRSYMEEEYREAQGYDTFETVYQLCIWQLDGETHTCVRDRLKLAREVIRGFFNRVDENRQKKRSEWRGAAAPPAAEGDDTKPVEPLELEDVPF